MKAIIPVKSSSIRVPNKNFKPFHDDDSLFDITVKKLLKILPPSEMHFSPEFLSSITQSTPYMN